MTMKKPTRITRLRDPRGPGLPNLVPSKERQMPAQMALLIQQRKEKGASLLLSQRRTLPEMVVAARKRFGPR
jgi:hypothetical protein